MTRKALSQKDDVLGLLAMGSIIVNLAQGKAQVDLRQQHQELLAHYQRLIEQYRSVCQSYATLRRINSDLAQQGRQYEKIIDSLRAELNGLRSAAVKGGAA